jgi:predicted MFS family arabinose efflux permease
MIDIAATFMIPIGVAGQLGTAAFVITVITAALTGVLTSKLPHKTLLILSICILCVTSIGCAFAPNFTVLLPIYALGGVNTGLAFTLVNSMIGRYYAVHERTRARSAQIPLHVSVGKMNSSS